MRPYSVPENVGWEAVARRELVIVDYRDEGGTIFLACKYVCKDRDLLHHVFAEDSEGYSDFFDEWWQEHGGAAPVPKTIAEAIARAGELCPVVIRWDPSEDTKIWTAVPMDTFNLATVAVN